MDYEEWFYIRQTQRVMLLNPNTWWDDVWEGKARKRRMSELECLLGY